MIGRAPKMKVKPIPKTFEVDRLSVAQDGGQNAEDMVAFHQFAGRVVIAGNKKSPVLAHLQNAVDHIFASAFNAVAAKEHGLQLFGRFRALFNHHHVAVFADQRHHANANVGVNEFAAFFQLLLKR